MKISFSLLIVLTVIACNNPQNSKEEQYVPLEATIDYSGVEASLDPPGTSDSMYQTVTGNQLLIKDMIKVRNGLYFVDGETRGDTFEIDYRRICENSALDTTLPEYVRADMRVTVNKSTFYIRFKKSSFARELNGETTIRDAGKDTVLQLN